MNWNYDWWHSGKPVKVNTSLEIIIAVLLPFMWLVTWYKVKRFTKGITILTTSIVGYLITMSVLPLLVNDLTNIYTPIELFFVIIPFLTIVIFTIKWCIEWNRSI